VTAQAEELARTAEQLQDLVARFHAEVGTDAGVDAAFEGDGDDEEEQSFVPRRRDADWGPRDARPGQVSRAS
jgi:hypothetical protein